MQAEWPSLAPAPTQTVKKGWGKKKWYFRVMSLEAMYRRYQVEDREPRDRKFSQDADAADLERGGGMTGLFQPCSTPGTRLCITKLPRSLKYVCDWGKFIGSFMVNLLREGCKIKANTFN